MRIVRRRSADRSGYGARRYRLFTCPCKRKVWRACYIREPLCPDCTRAAGGEPEARQRYATAEEIAGLRARQEAKGVRFIDPA